MILITTALHSEAKTLIEYFSLKKEIPSGTHQIFYRDQIQLIVTGIGKLRSAVATSIALSRAEESAIKGIINIGTAGARPNLSIGSIFAAHSIRDQASGRTFHPDMILGSKIAEAGLATFDAPVTSEKLLPENFDLVDMEASGFFQAAETFVSPDRIYCLKIVSDHFSCGALNAEHLQNIFTPNLHAIGKLVEQIEANDLDKMKVLNEENQDILDDISSSLRLSFSQQRILKDLTLRFLDQTNRGIEHLDSFRTRTVASRLESKKVFKELQECLRAS